MHPRAEANEITNQAIKAGEEIKIRNLVHWTEEFNLRFVHIRKYDEDFGTSHKGGATIAYQLPSYKGGNIIEVAVALVHDNDVFCKKAGRYYAAKNFFNGHTISLKVPKTTTPATFLKRMFFPMVG